jgi:hypothetical protein
MAKTNYTVLEVPGSSRTSARPYTHAVVAQYDNPAEAAHRDAELVYHQRKFWPRNYKHYQTWNIVNPSPYSDRDGYDEILAAFPTVEAYVADQTRKYNDKTAEIRARGIGELTVLTWSMSAANAEKGARSNQFRNYINKRVVACVVAEKAPKGRVNFQQTRAAVAA